MSFLPQVEKEQHVKALKLRIAEIKLLLDQHVLLLDKCKDLAPQFTTEFEQLRLDRINTLERARPDAEDY